MKSSHVKIITALFISFFSLSSYAEEGIWSDVKRDYSEFYSSERLTRMGVVFAGGAIMANTDIDQRFQDKNAGNIYSVEDAATVKLFGEGRILIPLSIISAGVSYYLNDGAELTGVGKWGELTARAYFVGGPTVLATQILTGASRPAEGDMVSDWRPFNDANGVSGHAFIGSVPFLAIAYMNQDNAFIKYSAYLASTLSGASRINDDAHYLSQVILGWYLGWESIDAVYNVDSKKKSNLRIQPMAGIDGYGIQLSMQW